MVLLLRQKQYHSLLQTLKTVELARILPARIGQSMMPMGREWGEDQQLALQDLPGEVEGIERREGQVQGEDLRELRTPKLTGKGEQVIQVEVDNPINQWLKSKRSWDR